jgi:hypothetical protein
VPGTYSWGRYSRSTCALTSAVDLVLREFQQDFTDNLGEFLLIQAAMR